MATMKVVTPQHMLHVRNLINFIMLDKRLGISLPDLVGSALSDPYLSYSAALFALAGPLHGHVPTYLGALEVLIDAVASPIKKF